MNCFAHIFIGKEFEQLVQEIGRATYKNGGSAVSSCINCFLLDLDSTSPTLKRLSIRSTATSPTLEQFDKYIQVSWIDNDIKEKELTDVYRLNIFNEILGGVNRGLHSSLYVCIHFPFYKESAFKQLSMLYKATRDARMPDKISFIGYCSDLAEMISSGEKNIEKLLPQAQVEAYKKFKTENDVLINQHLLLLQNSFQNGMPLNMSAQSMAETMSLLMQQYVDYYDILYPNTVTYSDVTAFGISAISLDKYSLVDYVFCNTVLQQMDSVSIMNDEVSVNEVFAETRKILGDKKELLSKLIESGQKNNYDIVNAEKLISDKADSLIDRCEEILQQNKSMTIRAAVLAALLQQKCELFNHMVYDSANLDLNDMYSEPIDYFINNDRAHLYWPDAETPLKNPILELKQINNQLINADTQIRKLGKEAVAYKEELDNVQTSGAASFGEDGYYHIDDKKYRLLPVTDEEPLQETYQAHPVSVTSLDLRDNFREIQDQGNQGSCLAFALASVFEYVMRSNNRHEEIDLSEAFLYYNARKHDEDSTTIQDTGSRFKPTIESLCKYGISIESLCRYDENCYDREPSREAYDDARKRLLRKALNVSRTVSDIKSALEDGYPVIGSFTLCPSFSNIVNGFVPLPTNEEIESSKNNDNTGNKHSRHAMVIVGYEDKLQCFITRNSWGKAWGDNGYCYIPYSYIENESLCNFTCILTEIESIETIAVPSKIPTFKLDDTNLNIRYQMSLIALQIERENMSKIEQKRTELVSVLEGLKQQFSNHNNCETYISENSIKIKEEQDAIKEKIKQERQRIDGEYESYRKHKKSLSIKTAIYATVILIVVWTYNYCITKLIGSKAQIIDNLNDFFESFDLKVDLVIDWAHYIVVLIIIGIFTYKVHRAWTVWREHKSEHERQISLYQRQELLKQNEIDSFRFNTHVACKWLSALNDVQVLVQQRYTNIVSRINELRKWYNDITEMRDSINMSSAVPNTTLLDKEILNGFLNDSHVHGIDFEKCSLDELRDDITLHLIDNNRLNDFNITEHILDNTFADIAQKVTSHGDDNSVSLANVKHQSDVFMHVNSRQRGFIMPSTYVVAPLAQQYDIKLRQKIKFDTCLHSSNAYRLIMLQIMCLEFDECVMFQ